MNIEIKNHLLKKNLNYLYKASYKSSSKIETNKFLFFEVKKDKIILFIKNENIFIQKEIFANEDLKIIESGKVIVNTFIFNELVQRTNQDLTIKVLDNNLLFLKTKKFKTEISCLDLKMWEDEKTAIKGEKFFVLAKDFVEGINQTIFATETKNLNSSLCGLNLKTTNRNLFLIATDGTKIAQRKLFPLDLDLDVVLPTFVLTEITRIYGLENFEKIAIQFNDEFVLFVINENLKIKSKIIKEKFPEVEKYFINNVNESLVCDLKNLTKAIEKASVFFDFNSLPTVVFTIKENKFIVSSPKKFSFGYFEEEIENVTFKNEFSKKIFLQSKIILNILKVVSEKEIAIDFLPKNDAVLFRSIADKKYQCIVLPLWE